MARSSSIKRTGTILVSKKNLTNILITSSHSSQPLVARSTDISKQYYVDDSMMSAFAAIFRNGSLAEEVSFRCCSTWSSRSCNRVPSPVDLLRPPAPRPPLRSSENTNRRLFRVCSCPPASFAHAPILLRTPLAQAHTSTVLPCRRRAAPHGPSRRAG